MGEDEVKRLVERLLEEARRLVQDEHLNAEQVCDKLLSELEFSVPGISSQREAFIEYVKRPKMVS